MTDGIAISIDSDGTMYDTHNMWIEIYNERYGKSVPKEYLDRWGFHDKLGISFDELMEIFSECWKRHSEIPLLNDKIPEFVDEIRGMGHRPIVVTVKAENWQFVAAMKANKHNGIKMDMYPCYHKSEKKNAGCKIYFDDDPELLQYLRNHQVQVVHPQLWNSHIREGDRLKIARSGWDSFMEILRNGVGRI